MNNRFLWTNSRLGFVNIPALIEKTEKGIEIARSWKQFDVPYFAAALEVNQRIA
jgi:hypothetical protein